MSNECTLCGAPGAVHRSDISEALYCNEKCEAADNPPAERLHPEQEHAAREIAARAAAEPFHLTDLTTAHALLGLVLAELDHQRAANGDLSKMVRSSNATAIAACEERDARPRKADLLRAEADEFAAFCPDHGSQTTSRLECLCDVADDLRRKANKAAEAERAEEASGTQGGA